MVTNGLVAYVLHIVSARASGSGLACLDTHGTLVGLVLVMDMEKDIPVYFLQYLNLLCFSYIFHATIRSPFWVLTARYPQSS